jgi:hypothetical protein
MHIYHVASGRLVAAILRPARTPKGTEVRTVIKHVTKHLKQHWPNTRIEWRGDSHYGRVEAMEWAEENGDDYTHLYELHVPGQQLDAAAQGGGEAGMFAAAGADCLARKFHIDRRGHARR